VRLPEQEADDAIAGASHALEVLGTGQADTASQIDAAQVRAIAALAGAVGRRRPGHGHKPGAKRSSPGLSGLPGPSSS
jgi:hypothetical protein